MSKTLYFDGVSNIAFRNGVVVIDCFNLTNQTNEDGQFIADQNTSVAMNLQAFVNAYGSMQQAMNQFAQNGLIKTRQAQDAQQPSADPTAGIGDSGLFNIDDIPPIVED